MRVSTFEKDPGYIDYLEHGRWHVYLSGELVTGKSSGKLVLTADEDLGYILYHKVPDGCSMGFVLTEDKRPALYIEYGLVKIIPVPDKFAEATEAAGR